jgi:hypothetical protein
MSTLTSIINDLKPEATAIITSALTTNPNLSQAQATVAVMRNVDQLLGKLGPLGIFAEGFVNLYIQTEVPAIYTKLVQDAVGTAPGSAIVTEQNA